MAGCEPRGVVPSHLGYRGHGQIHLPGLVIDRTLVVGYAAGFPEVGTPRGMQSDIT